MSSRLFENRELVCPACRGALTFEWRSARVLCSGCGRTFPIREGIPVLLLEEASPPTASPAARK